MPLVLKFKNFKFYIYFHDHAPPHVHVICLDMEAKFEIDTGKCLKNHGFSEQVLNKLSKKVQEYSEEFKEVWNEYKKEESN